METKFAPSFLFAFRLASGERFFVFSRGCGKRKRERRRIWLEGNDGQSAEGRAQTVSQACKGTQTEATEVVKEVAISQACMATQTMQTPTSNASTNTEDSKKQPHVARKARRVVVSAKEKTKESQPKKDPPCKSVLEMIRKQEQFGKATDSDEDFKEAMRLNMRARYELLKNPFDTKTPSP